MLCLVYSYEESTYFLYLVASHKNKYGVEKKLIYKFVSSQMQCKIVALMWKNKPHPAVWGATATGNHPQPCLSIPTHHLHSVFSGPVQTREETRYTSSGPRPGHICTHPHTTLTQPSSGSSDSHPSSPCHQHSQVLLPPWAPCRGPGHQPRRSHCCRRDCLHWVWGGEGWHIWNGQDRKGQQFNNRHYSVDNLRNILYLCFVLLLSIIQA